MSVAEQMSLCLMRAMWAELSFFIRAVILQMYDLFLLSSEKEGLGGGAEIIHRVHLRNSCRQIHKSCHVNQSRLRKPHISFRKTITDRTEKDGVGDD